MFYYLEGESRAEIIESDHYPEELMISRKGGWASSLSSGFKTKEELIIHNCIQNFNCVQCDKMIAAHYVEPVKAEMINNKLCFGCNLWIKRSTQLTERNIISGKNFYSIASETESNRSFRGFGGREFTFVKLDGTIITSTNVWYGGEIPQHLKHLFPDNVKLTDSDMYAPTKSHV